MYLGVALACIVAVVLNLALLALQISRHRRTALRWLCRACRGREVDALTPYIEAQLLQWRLLGWKIGMDLSLLGMGCGLTFFVASAFVLENWDDDLGDTEVIVSRAIPAYCVCLVIRGMLVVIEASPGYFGRGAYQQRVVDLMYFLLVACFVVNGSSTPCERPLGAIGALVRAGPSCWNLSLPQAVVGETLFAMMTLSMRKSNSCLVDADITVHVITMWAVIFAAALVSCSVQALADTHVKERGARNEQAALKRLLGSFCDAVVQVDSSLQICAATPNFAAMLQKSSFHNASSSRPQLVNESFAGLIASQEDRARFRTHLANVPRGQVDTLVGHELRLSLRDGIGSRVPVQLFVSCSLDLAGEVCYTMGVTECSDLVLGPRQRGPLEDSVAPIGKGLKEHIDRSRWRSALAREGRGLPTLPSAQQPGCSSHSPPPSERSGDVFVPGCRPTTELGKQVALISLLQRWNFAKDDACCSIHAGSREVMRLATNILERRPCCQIFPPTELPTQCAGCATLKWVPDNEDSCDVCSLMAGGSDSSVAESRTSVSLAL